MDISEILNLVNAERIYQHILKLEGTRHPIDTPEKLNEAADYIHSQFEEYGLAVNDQEFKVEGFDATFRNVEGLISEGDGPELLIVGHYDTVADCPGADDNASAVAIMLEAARVLSQAKIVHDVRFVSFTLEEMNPANVLRLRMTAQDLGLMDARNRYTSVHAQKLMKQLLELQRKSYSDGKNPSEALAEARSQLESQMSESEAKYAREMEEMLKGITLVSWPGKSFDMGSAFWVDEAVRAKRQVLGVICYDTVGYTSEKQHSQTFPKGIDPNVFQTYNVKDATVGNFLAVIGDVNSGKLIQSFCGQCKLDLVGLPFACLQVPLQYEAIAQVMFDLLRSDHAPFWRAGIPAIFLTDTGDFRYPYYHTQADTIDKLDFDFITKVCKATVATAIHLTHKA